MSRAQPDSAMAELFRLPREWVIGAEFLERPPRSNLADLEPGRASRQRRARLQALALMLGSGLVSVCALYGLWSAVQKLL